MNNPYSRASWEIAKIWYNSKLEAWSCIERSTGIYVNCRSQQELYSTLWTSPSVRADIIQDKLTLELFHGKPILAIDKRAAKHVLKKIKDGKWEGVRLLSDDKGGALIMGEQITINADDAMVAYAATMIERNNGSRQDESAGPAAGTSTGTLPAGDEGAGTVSPDGSPEAERLQSEQVSS